MKIFKKVLVAILIVLMTAGMAYASGYGCGGTVGRCENPDRPSVGCLGNSDAPWNTANINTLTVNTDVILPAEKVGAGEIANVTRPLPGIGGGLAGWVVDSADDIDDASAPEMGTADNIPAIIWDNSGETAGIQKTFRLPPDYVADTALVFYALISSNTADGTSTKLDWMLWDNADGTAFDAAEIGQSTVTSTEASLDVKCDVLTLTLDATGIAAMTAGHFYTIEVFNATTHATANLELKGFDGVYTAKQ